MKTQVDSGIDFDDIPVSQRLELVIDDLMAIYTGALFGYFDYLASCGPSTAVDLAQATAASRRAMSEWLERQVAVGILEVDGAPFPVSERVYRMPNIRKDLLVLLENPIDSSPANWMNVA